jgi:hypothetical protein
LPVTGQIGVFALGAGCFVIAALVVAALGIETKGRMLEDVSAKATVIRHSEAAKYLRRGN